MTGRPTALDDRHEWLSAVGKDEAAFPVDGLVRVEDYDPAGLTPEEVVVLEKAKMYKAHSVFFSAAQNGRPSVPQAFIYVSRDGQDNPQFAELHKRLWSWGGVPLLYRKIGASIELFRCAHDPDFATPGGGVVCSPFDILDTASKVASSMASWWDAEQLRNCTLWDDPKVCKQMLSTTKAAHRKLVEAIEHLYENLSTENILPDSLCRRLLVLCVLISYLEEREVLRPDFFSSFFPKATRFFQVVRDGPATALMLAELERRFNGGVFSLSEAEHKALLSNRGLVEFSDLVEGYKEPDGQLTLWRLYSFRDLPVELLSQVYQLFADDKGGTVYTPPSLVRLILEEALSWQRLDLIVERRQVVLDPACGSGIFLVEVYKRMVLHWRMRNSWARPDVNTLRKMFDHIHGVDVEKKAVEVAMVSLFLAMCDALEPSEIRSSVRMFPPLIGQTLHSKCFFEAVETNLIQRTVGAVVGNPPFESALTTPGAERRYAAYQLTHGRLADKQLAYLFLHEAMELLEEDGVTAMVQPAGFLYNINASLFRRTFFDRWTVREVLDFVSVPGLFKKAGVSPRVLALIAEPGIPTDNLAVLHAVFRGSGRAIAEQGFDIDYYDLHWIDGPETTSDTDLWRANLLGGGRFFDLLTRLRKYRTLGEYAKSKGWNFGEGFIAGKSGNRKAAPHLTGKLHLPTKCLSESGIDAGKIEPITAKLFKRPKTPERFKAPMLLVKESQNLYNDIWLEHDLAYKHEIVGFAAPDTEVSELSAVQKWLTENLTSLRAYVAGISSRLFSQRATAIGSVDIYAIPYPEEGTLDLSDNEKLVIDDVVSFGRDFVRRGGKSSSIRSKADDESLGDFAAVFCSQLSTVYPGTPVMALECYRWPGIICQPFVFGEGEVDWSDAEGLRDKLDILLREKRETSLTITRIARIYEDRFVFLMKPDRLRFWLRSVALRDADDVLADLREQGF